MFPIQCSPFSQSMTMTEYAQQLFDRFILPHYQHGIELVHLIFDTPSFQAFNPKNFEQKSRDEKHNCEHEHIKFFPSTQVPKNWRVFVECRQCKKIYH